MELLLKRIALRDTYTIGKLYIDGVYFCDTVEDKVRDLNKDGDLEDAGETKVYSETAIPYGVYKVIVNKSPKFKRLLPRLLNVKHFEGILIHRGSSAKSSAGCIIVGKNTIVGRVTDSEKYELELVKLLLEVQNKKEEIIIKIV